MHGDPVEHGLGGAAVSNHVNLRDILIIIIIVLLLAIG